MQATWRCARVIAKLPMNLVKNTAPVHSKHAARLGFRRTLRATNLRTDPQQSLVQRVHWLQRCVLIHARTPTHLYIAYVHLARLDSGRRSSQTKEKRKRSLRAPGTASAAQDCTLFQSRCLARLMPKQQRLQVFRVPKTIYFAGTKSISPGQCTQKP